MKNKFLILVLISFGLIFSLSGCVTAPLKGTISTYNINGVTYYPLISLCESRGINWEYDTFTKIVTLTKGPHKVIFKAGDNLVLVDHRAEVLNEPIDIYEGTVVVPLKLKEQVIDGLFKEEKSTGVKTYTFPLSQEIKKVVIDAGHGGNDPGAIGRTGLREKDVNLDIAKRLTLLLKKEGVEVVMTRSSDRFIPLERRVQITNNARADLFISIHSNANHTKSMNGFEAYYVATSINDAKRAVLASKSANLNLDNASIVSNAAELRAILWDMIYVYDRAESIQLARNICRSVSSNMDVKILGVKDARYHVLRGARVPAVLVETGFVTNFNEERMLKNGFYRQKIAESIMDGISNYAQDLASTEVAQR